MTAKNDIIDLYRHDLSSFIEYGFNKLHPYEIYSHNWHIDVLAHALTRVAHGEIKKLVINMPPRMLKSHCASVVFPAWLLGRNPMLKLLYLHAGDEQGRNSHGNCVELMQCRRYQHLFPHSVGNSYDHRKILTPQGGSRKYSTYSGKITGIGADIIILDDPISATDSLSAAAREEANKIFDHNIMQRLNNKKDSAINDPYPSNMRHQYTFEEMVIAGQEVIEYQAQLMEQYDPK